MNTISHDSTDSFFTVQEISAMLRVSVLTLYKYIKEQKLEAIQIGGHYRIGKSSLDKFLVAHTVGSNIATPDSSGK